jgi:hypothetical protein
VIRAALAGLLALLLAGNAAYGRAERVDTALVLAVDVSGSVDAERYRLQMEGIARTFEDEGVQASMLGGPHRAIFVTLVEWSDRPAAVVPWTLITGADDAKAFAASVRRAPRADDQFTCMAVALRLIADKVLPFLPAPSDRIVIDVSGDGHDNCNPIVPVDAVRNELVAAGATINGLPILEGDEALTLEAWYRAHVIGGPGAFLVPASGFADFARAMRSKFLIEISRAPALIPIRARETRQ